VSIVVEVPSLWLTLRECDVFVCPLRFGGGIKVKLIEALRAGCAIVTMPKALQGFPAAARRAVVVAEGADGFAAAVLALLRDQERRAELSQAAVECASALPTWDEAARAVFAGWHAALGVSDEAMTREGRFADGRRSAAAASGRLRDEGGP